MKKCYEDDLRDLHKQKWNGYGKKCCSLHFNLRKTVLVEYSHSKRYYHAGEKNIIKKHFLLYSKNNLGAATWLKKNKRFSFKIKI